MVMLTEVVHRWRFRRGARGAVAGTRTALPLRFCTTALAVPAPAPEVLGLGGDELRVRASLRALGVEL